jgi:hypothetical protein
VAANSGVPADSLCPSCGRTTRTTTSGACAECWQAKTSSGRGIFRRHPPRTERLFDFNLDALNLLPAWAWWVAAGGVITAIVFAVRAFIAA